LIGTDNKTGKEIANTLEDRYNIIVNKNTIPNDNRSVFETSGIRIGTAAMVTKHGADSNYFSNIAEKIVKVIKE
jgi:glycine hydroxymethyltransferase